VDNLKMLNQTIKFQRTALQNSLALVYTVQQHGQKFLESTLDQSPWIPGDSKKVCLFWADFYTKNLTGVTDLVDQNLAKLERMATREKEAKKAQEKPSAPMQRPEPPEPSATAKKTAPEEKAAAEKTQVPEKEPSTKPAEEKTVTVKASELKALVADQPCGEQDRPSEKMSGQPSEKRSDKPSDKQTGQPSGKAEEKKQSDKKC